jgi:proteic killer suppression protein
MLRAAVGPRLGGRLSLWVSGNWRLTFVFDGEDVILLDYQDYH